MCVENRFPPDNIECDLAKEFNYYKDYGIEIPYLQRLEVNWQRVEPGTTSPKGVTVEYHPVWAAFNDNGRTEMWVCDECYYQHRLLALLKAGHLD